MRFDQTRIADVARLPRAAARFATIVTSQLTMEISRHVVSVYETKMMHWIWRLSEGSDEDNLGLACTDQGLVLGGTALIERRDGRFVVRDANEIGRLLSRAYSKNFFTDPIMPGLATVAAALNANDQGLARIAAVHLRLPDLRNRAARDGMAALDVLIKYARDEGDGGGNWNPGLHPRAGTPPNPGWFVTTGDAGNR